MAWNSINFRRSCYLLAILLWSAAGFARAAAAPSSPARILVLNSYHIGLRWTEKITSGLKAALPGNAQVTYEYMDAKRHPDETYLGLFHELMRQKYRGERFDVLIAIDDDAFQFMLRHRDEIFPDTPLIFCGVNIFNEQMLAGRSRIGGVVEANNAWNTVQAALRLHPDCRQINVFSTNPETYQKIQAELVSELKQAQLPVEVRLLNEGGGLDLVTLGQKLSSLPDHSLVLMTDFYRDKDGHFIDFSRSLPHLAQVCRSPIYVLSDLYLGMGVVGGLVNSAYNQGVEAGKMATRTLSGAAPLDGPMVKLEARQYIFDNLQLKRWGINLRDLPAGRVLINAPNSLLSISRSTAWKALAILMIQSAIILVLILNIRRRRSAERALRLSEKECRGLIESIPQFVWTNRPDGQTTFISSRWHQYSGMPLERTLNGAWRESLHPDDAPRMLQMWQQALQNAQAYTLECRYRRAADGMYRWHLVQMIPIYDDDGQLVEWVGTAQDIDALKRAEQERAEADRRKDEFLAMLAHELRNPLAPIRNASQVLRLIGTADPRLQRQRDIIDRQVGHMARLLDDLLDVSRITRGLIHLRMEPLDLRQVVDRMLESVRPQVEQRSLTLEYHHSAPRVMVMGDATRLEQVILNLLGNALKFTGTGGCITVELVMDTPITAVVRVRDTGIGIAPEMLPRIFDLFTQAEPSGQRGNSGLGIGLTMAHSLVQMHGGSIEARSEGLDKGSEFTVRLPLLAGVAPEADGNGALPVEAAQAPVPAVGQTILVVEDVQDTAHSMAEILGLWGHRVTIAYSGREALARAGELSPDVVLLDIGLPEMSGYEVARRLRQELKLDQAVLIAITGFGTQEDREQSACAGIDRHMTKPVDLAELESILREVSARKAPVG